MQTSNDDAKWYALDGEIGQAPMIIARMSDGKEYQAIYNNRLGTWWVKTENDWTSVERMPTDVAAWRYVLEPNKYRMNHDIPGKMDYPELNWFTAIVGAHDDYEGYEQEVCSRADVEYYVSALKNKIKTLENRVQELSYALDNFTQSSQNATLEMKLELANEKIKKLTNLMPEWISMDDSRKPAPNSNVLILNERNMTIAPAYWVGNRDDALGFHQPYMCPKDITHWMAEYDLMPILTLYKEHKIPSHNWIPSKVSCPVSLMKYAREFEAEINAHPDCGEIYFTYYNDRDAMIPYLNQEWGKKYTIIKGSDCCIKYELKKDV